MIGDKVTATDIVIVLCAVAFLLWGLVSCGVSIGKQMERTVMQRQAVEKGHAEYDSKTGQWKWK